VIGDVDCVRLRAMSGNLVAIGDIEAGDRGARCRRAQQGAARTDAVVQAVRDKWQDFVTEYNVVLAQWKEFTERMEQTIRSGAPTGAAMAKPLPSSVK